MSRHNAQGSADRAGKGPWPDALPADGIDHHYFAGYLWSTAARGEAITTADWNEAVLAARAFETRKTAEAAERSETAKRNAIAKRRREAGRPVPWVDAREGE